MPAERPRAARGVLLTGFDPFGGAARNPSWEAVRALRGARIGGHAVAVARIPTSFTLCAPALARAIARHRPALVLCTGLAQGRAAVSLERVAINCIDARIADNDGLQPIDAPVVAGAPAAYFARLPLKAMLAAVRARGIPAEVSNSAGTFVCNALAFHLAHGIATRWPRLRGGFVHLPAAPFQVADQPATPSMALATMVEALRAAVAAALAQGDDIALGAGTEH